jgi:hypothetical protein
MHPGLFIQYLQIMVSPLQQRLLLVKYHCRWRCGELSAGEIAGKDFCRQLHHPQRPRRRHSIDLACQLAGLLCTRRPSAGPSGSEFITRGKASTHRGVPMQVQSPNSSIGAFPMHVATCDARQSNATPWNTIEMPCPRASQGIRVYKTAQTVLA